MRTPKRRSGLAIPPLPASFRFDGAGNLSVNLSGKRLRLPVVELNDARLSTVQSLLKVKQPHVIVAPHLSASAKESIESADWGWVESSGNAHIATQGVFLHIERPDRGVPRGGAAIAIPPQGERVIRQLLDTYPKSVRFSDISRQTQLDKGYASRILSRLRDAGLVSYERSEPVEVANPAELFEAWQTLPPRAVESPWFIPGINSIDKLATRIQREVGDEPLAFTGVFASNLLVPHLEPERIDLYVSDLRIAERIARALEGEPARKGSNVGFLVHRDPGVLTIGTRPAGGLTVASVSQVYRDALLRGRGREREAANEFRRRLLAW